MKKFIVLWGLALVMFILAVVSIWETRGKSAIVYSESLEETIATVQGEPLTLRDFAIYVAHQEKEVESQALVYDDKDTNKYWNIHTNGKFIRYAARDGALGMAIHDTLFYQLAEDMQLGLTEEEQKHISNDVMDCWMDLLDEGKEQKLGIQKEDVQIAYEKIALAEKAQAIYAEMDSVKYEDYNYGKEAYERFLSNYKYEVKDVIADRLRFGYITLEH